MKYFFALLFSFLMGQAVVAQGEAPAPVREATNTPKDPILGPKEFELKRFSAQLLRMQNAYTAKDAGKVGAFHSAILMAMRNAMDERRTRPVAVPTAARDLEKMQQIFSAFETFIGFDKATPEEATAKFKLLENFQALLQSQYDTLKAQAAGH